MKKSTKIHFLIVSFINLFLATNLILKTAESGSCKSILWLIIPFPILILLNGIIWLVLLLMKKFGYKIYKFNSLVLVLLLILRIILATKI